MRQFGALTGRRRKHYDEVVYRIGMENFRAIAEEVLRRGKTFSFVAGGSSMSPFIRDGDTVVVAPVLCPKIGEVVLCKTCGGLVLHRVVSATPAGIITRGDACASDDAMTPPGDVLGKAVRVSGAGLNFHLRYPFGMLIARGLLSPSRISHRRLLFNLAKRVAVLLG